MSWLLRSSKKMQEPERVVETVLGISCVVKNLGDDLLVEGRARTRRDADRLKRMVVEMLDEVLGGGGEVK